MRIVGHQNLHLPLWEILDVLVECACLFVLNVYGAAGFLVLLVAKELPALHGEVAPGNGMLGGGAQEVPCRLLIPRAERHGCVGRGSDILLESTPHVHELREALHGEEEGRVGAPGRLQNLGEVPVTKLREFIEHDAEHRPVRAAALLVAFVPFAHNQLEVSTRILSL